MKTFRLLTLILALATAGQAAPAKLNVVATLPDLGSIAQEIGGDSIKVTSIARGTEDAHFVDAKPSFIRILNQADLLIEGGAELEIGWLPPLANNARNGKILGNSPGHLIASTGLRLLQVPTGPVDRSMGDVHPTGNPHYLLDPGNGKLVAASIAARLSELDPANATGYAANLAKFNAKLDEKLAGWLKQMEPFRGTKVVTYHKSFDYLLDRFGLVLAGTIEPKPGIEPSPTHINALIPQMKQAGVKLIIIEPNRPVRTPTYLAKQTGAKLLVLPGLPGGHAQAKDYFGLFDYDIGAIAAALKAAK